VSGVVAPSATLVWSDEFDGPAGSPPDPATWTHELGDGSAHGIPGWGNGELQAYTDDPANAALDGEGSLVLTARRSSDGFTSARLRTKGRLELLYGRIEARLRVPRGAGTWPAFWALGAGIDVVPWPACGEIDVMEHAGREPRRVYGTIHGPGYSGPGCYGRFLDLDADLADDFHVFAVDWAPRRLVWSCDGIPYHEAAPEDVAPADWVFQRPFFLLLNLAVGGTFGGPVDPAPGWAPSLLVDDVRAYQLPERAPA
jgi:beta-glucanase (GH16 family)